MRGLIDVEDERLRIELPIFMLVLAYLLLLLYETIQLRPDPRMVPIMILIPTIAIVIAHTINIVRPGTLPRLGTFSDFLSVGDEEGGEEDKYAGIRESIRISIWFTLFVVSVFLVGFILSTALFAFLFLYFEGDQTWQRSLLVSVILVTSLYLIFIELINVRPIDTIIPLGLP